MRKKNCLIFVMLMVLSIFIVSLVFDKNVKAYDLGDVDLLICNPGEDASTEMNFSFHTSVSGVVVEVAKKSDGNFDNAIKVTPTYKTYKEAYPFDGEGTWGVNYGAGYDISKVSVCEASVTGLEPDTEYMYRVGATNFSETRYFKTAGNDGSFAFAIMADPQVFGQTPADTSNETMNRALARAKKMNMDIELVLSAGDNSNTGGLIDEWRMLYDLDIYKEMPLASCIGNHDVLDSAGGKITTGTYVFDSVNNSPKNGPETNTEGVYYFVWDNVLFVILDSEVTITNYNEQIAWFEEVVETVPHQYIIVMYHRACWGSTAEAAKYWYPTFEKYNIDLSFSGDNHDYGRGSTNVGTERGQKNFPNNYIVCDDTRNAANVDKVNLGGYYLVQVTPQNLKFYAFDQNDVLLDSCTFSAKRTGSTASFDKDEFMDNLKIEVLESDATKATLSWSGNDFANSVGDITLFDQNNKKVDSAYANNLNKASLVFGGLESSKSYTYKVSVEFKDGTTETKDITFETKVNYGKYSSIELKELSTTYRLLFDSSDIKSNLFEKVNVYIDGQLKAEYNATAKFVAIEKDLLTATSKVELKGVVKSDKSEVLIGTFTQGETKEPVLTVETKDFELEVGSEKEIKASVDSGKVVYASSDEKVATVDANGKVKALKAGTVKITVSVEGYSNIKQEINVKVTEKTSEEPTKLSKPEIKLEEATLTINSVNGATQYEIYIDGNLKETITNLTVDLSKYALGEGSYKVTVKAKNDSNESELSSEATFVVKGEEPTPTPEPVESGCNSGSIQTIWYVVSILGLALVLKKKRF